MTIVLILIAVASFILGFCLAVYLLYELDEWLNEQETHKRR